MTVYVNEQPREVEASATLLRVLEALGYRREQVAAAVNTAFVPRSRHAEYVLQAGDRLDIVGPMQGG